MAVRDDETLAELATSSDSRARVLDRFGLDWCCGGGRTLGEACAQAGVDTGAVRAALDAADAQRPPETPEWAELEPVALTEHLRATHHAYLDAELPALAALARKVLAAHGERHPELREVARLVDELRGELEPHLRKEELVLFPAIEALVEGHIDAGVLVDGPIARMRVEHDAAGDLLARLRAAARDFTAPADACASYESLYRRLEALEHDTHLHVHKENNVLFAAVERQATSSAA
jgi:regulator of cell morphogenesis and NO signaling